MRVVLDTNLWISFLISGSFVRLNPLIESGEVTFVFCATLLEEISRVARREKFRTFFSMLMLENLLDALSTTMDAVSVTSMVNVCRDPNDDYLLALSRHSRADYLLTGDKDLLSLENFEGTRICTITDFLAMHTGS